LAVIQCQQKRFEAIAAVIFDKDGTLADSAELLQTMAKERSQQIEQQVPGVGASLLTAFGFTQGHLNPAGLMAVGSRRENEIAAATYIAATGKGWIDSLAIAQAAFVAVDQRLPRKATLTPLFPGIHNLLQSLQAANVKLAVLSSDTTANVKDFVQLYQLESYFHLLMGTEQGLTKPDPSLFLRACAALNVLPEETLMVGDSAADVVMAVKAGAAGCIEIQHGRDGAIALPGADIMIAKWAEMQVLS
jgi:phosphoglycolate phosphatase